MPKKAEWFPCMVDVLPEMVNEDFAIKHFEINKAASQASALRARLNGRRWYEYVAPGKYVRLTSPRGIEMTDATMERISCSECVRNARGSVLLGGLGLGMLLCGLMRKRGVSTIIVVEKSPEIIAMVEPHLRAYFDKVKWKSTVEKVNTVLGDATNPASFLNGRLKFDTIYMDIWSNICKDNLPEMRKLKQKYMKYRKSTGWFGCWSEDLAKL